MGRVEFIGRFGCRMYVDESRVEEYKKAGFMPANSSVEPKTTEEAKPKQPERKKANKRYE